MRLIDADKIDFNEVFVGASKFAEDTRQAGKMLIDAQPTAYDVDKVVEELEDEREYAHADFEQYAELHGIDTEDDWFYAGMRRAIEIVKAGGTKRGGVE